MPTVRGAIGAHANRSHADNPADGPDPLQAWNRAHVVIEQHKRIAAQLLNVPES